jgi:hypothetical protein
MSFTVMITASIEKQALVSFQYQECSEYLQALANRNQHNPYP